MHFTLNARGTPDEIGTILRKQVDAQFPAGTGPAENRAIADAVVTYAAKRLQGATGVISVTAAVGITVAPISATPAAAATGTTPAATTPPAVANASASAASPAAAEPSEASESTRPAGRTR